MKKQFAREDYIRYTLQDYEAEVKKLLYNSQKKEVDYLEVLVTKSYNPEIEENVMRWISADNFKYVELIPNDSCNLGYSERQEFGKVVSLLEERLLSATRKHRIDQALEKRDKQLFLELTGGDAQ